MRRLTLLCLALVASAILAGCGQLQQENTPDYRYSYVSDKPNTNYAEVIELLKGMQLTGDHEIIQNMTTATGDEGRITGSALLGTGSIKGESSPANVIPFKWRGTINMLSLPANKVVISAVDKNVKPTVRIQFDVKELVGPLTDFFWGTIRADLLKDQQFLESRFISSATITMSKKDMEKGKALAFAH